MKNEKHPQNQEINDRSHKGGGFADLVSNGMKYDLSNLLKKLGDGVSLSSVEKERMLHIVSEYVSLQPVSHKMGRASAGRASSFMYVGIFTRPIAAVLVVGIILSGAGVSYAAESAVPGDVLYPIKVSVNEEVRSAFAQGHEKKAEWEAVRAERRLEEAATLAVQGTLDDARREYLATRFERHADAVVSNAGALEESDAPAALDIVTGFEARLAAHEALLEELNGPSRSVLAALKTREGRITAVRIRAEKRFAYGVTRASAVAETSLMLSAERTEDVDETSDGGDRKTNVGVFEAATGPAEAAPSGQGGSEEDSGSDTGAPDVAYQLRLAAQKAHTEASALFERIGQRLRENDREKTRELLEKSAHALREGGERLDHGAYKDALERFRTSLELSQRAIVFAKASVRLDIRIADFPRDEDPIVSPDDNAIDAELHDSILPEIRDDIDFR